MEKRMGRLVHKGVNSKKENDQPGVQEKRGGMKGGNT